MWSIESYESGTVIVHNVTDPKMSYFYVYGTTDGNERERYNIAVDLAIWLNFPHRMPMWAMDLKVNPELATSLITDSGISITATRVGKSEDYLDEQLQMIRNLLHNRSVTKYAYRFEYYVNKHYVKD